MSDVMAGLTSRVAAGRARWAHPLYRGLAWTAALVTVFVIYTWLATSWGPFVSLDHTLNRNFHVRRFWPELHVFDRVGQRVLCLRPLAVVILVVAWRRRSWRPVLLGVFGVVLVNLLVLIVKLALSRGAPLSGQSFFADGDLYPSGHTSNVVVVYGLCYYLITRYTTVAPWVKRALLTFVCLCGAIQFTTSILLRWHWFSDLIGGFLIGGVVMALVAVLDASLPKKATRAAVRSQQAMAEIQPVPDGELELAEVSPLRKRDDSRATAGDHQSRR